MRHFPERNVMQIIDFHTHIYPDAIAEKATRTTCAYYHLDTPLIGTAEQLLAQGKKAGISRCVLLPVAMKPEQTRRVNEFIQSQTQAHPEFFGFGALHPALPDLLGELSFLQEQGFYGVKLHPDLQEFDLDDERLFPAYDWLQGRLPVLFHCGDKTRDYSHPKRLRRVLDNFPNLAVIAAHLGGWSGFDEAFALLRDTDCRFDISSCMGFLPPEQMRAYIRGYGAERVLFGSDFPLWDPVREVQAFLGLGLTQREQELIAFGNAQRLLGISG